LKKDTAEAVVEVLRPVQERHKELCADPGYLEGVLRDGAERARGMARPTVDAAYRAIGLLPAASDTAATNTGVIGSGAVLGAAR
jgi:tryptophanyl-tRNA synthetase